LLSGEAFDNPNFSAKIPTDFFSSEAALNTWRLMAITTQTLSQLALFSQLDDEAVRGIRPHVHERTFAGGQIILVEGEPCQAVYFVVRGLVRTQRLSPEGREQVLAYLGPGASFNLVPAIDGGPHLATVSAVSDSTLYTISCQHFRRIMREHQPVAQAVLERMAADVRRLSDMVEDLALHTVRTRLARFLLHQAQSPAPPARRWTQVEIANHIGTAREMVGRTLRTFRDEGLIRRERGRITIIDRAGLERQATGSEDS
jgi:CRP-like cAMP-binding protein